MKILLENIVLSEISDQHFYRLTEEHGNKYLEEMKTSQVPNDQNSYFIPAEISNHKGEVKLGLIYCVPAIRVIQPPILVPDNTGHLVEILETGFIDLNKDYDVNPLINPEFYDGEMTETSSDDIEWCKFIPSEIPSDQAYFFIPSSSRIADIDTELGAYEIGLPISEFAPNVDNSGINLFDVCEFVLRKVRINCIPTTGLIWYLPVDIIFNSKQSRRGYLLYNSVGNETMDVHIFDCKIGLVSVLNNDEGLEDCGIFKDDRVFSYQLLLSDVNPAVRNESKSANTGTDAG